MLEILPEEAEQLEGEKPPEDDPFAPCPTYGRPPAVPIKSLQDRFEYLNKVREEKRQRDRERRFAKLPTLEKPGARSRFKSRDEVPFFAKGKEEAKNGGGEGI
jgi:hypothetical protein